MNKEPLSLDELFAGDPDLMALYNKDFAPPAPPTPDFMVPPAMPKPLSDFLSGKPLNSPEKYYVAATRPRYSLAIVIDKPPKSSVFEAVDIPVGSGLISGYRYIEQ